eukprot:366299-Chlamydomonas_euryale.AAC.3
MSDSRLQGFMKLISRLARSDLFNQQRVAHGMRRQCNRKVHAQCTYMCTVLQKPYTRSAGKRYHRGASAYALEHYTRFAKPLPSAHRANVGTYHAAPVESPKHCYA